MPCIRHQSVGSEDYRVRGQTIFVHRISPHGRNTAEGQKVPGRCLHKGAQRAAAVFGTGLFRYRRRNFAGDAVGHGWRAITGHRKIQREHRNDRENDDGERYSFVRFHGLNPFASNFNALIAGMGRLCGAGTPVHQ